VSVPATDPGGGPSPTALLETLEEAQRAGFLGPGPLPPHLRHAEGFVAAARRQLAPAAPAATPRLLDLGSGGGLPGLVVATAMGDISIVLLDANVRRTAFLVRAVRRLGLTERVQVVQERAERAGRRPDLRGTFDGVVVRSFGPPAVVAECAAPFLRVGGWLVVSEPPGDPEKGPPAAPVSERWPAADLSQFGLEPGELLKEEFGYQLLHQSGLCPDRFPRRDGVPAKHPLF
jgi:16S rRNA (guanine527-N7)-methyltransferase